MKKKEKVPLHSIEGRKNIKTSQYFHEKSKVFTETFFFFFSFFLANSSWKIFFFFLPALIKMFCHNPCDRI